PAWISAASVVASAVLRKPWMPACRLRRSPAVTPPALPVSDIYVSPYLLGSLALRAALAEQRDEVAPPHGAYPKAKDQRRSIAGLGVGQGRACNKKRCLCAVRPGRACGAGPHAVDAPTLLKRSGEGSRWPPIHGRECARPHLSARQK